MSKKIQLTIPTPCHENWENMLPADKGKFCLSCSKEVIDFTAMSDLQLVAFFKKPSTGSVCGRFQDYQLDRQIIEPRKKLPWIKYFFQFALPAFLVSMKVNAQQSELQGEVVTSQQVIKKGKPVVRKRSINPIVIPEIKGRVVDEAGLPLAYSSVLIKGTKRGVAADSDGYFAIKTEPEDELVILVVSSVGFEIQEETIDINKYTNMDRIVTLKQKSLEEVVVIAGFTTGALQGKAGGVSYSVKPVTFWEQVKDSFTLISPNFSIYPNPAIAGSSITIQNKKLTDDNYSIQVMNLSGQLIHNEQQQISKNQNLKLNMPFVPAGAYFIRLTGRKNGKTYSEKLIVK